jgi:hypothetical protein
MKINDFELVFYGKTFYDVLNIPVEKLFKINTHWFNNKTKIECMIIFQKPKI